MNYKPQQIIIKSLIAQNSKHYLQFCQDIIWQNFEIDNLLNIINRMASNERSFLSQVVLDSSKIKESLSSTILPPLHTGQSSYIAYKHRLSSKNHHNRPLPFGSTSSRIIQQLQPKISNPMVSYESEKSNQKNVNEKCISPFGSTENRFKQINRYSPGPGRYQSEKINTIENSRSSCIFGRETKDLKKDSEKQNFIGPGSYQVEANPTQCRQKIAQKYRDHKRKYIQNLIRISKKHQQEIKPINCSQLPLNSSQSVCKERVSLDKRKAEAPINRFILKDHTKKYIAKGYKENVQHVHQNEPSCSIYNNFTYNFIQKYDDAFSSYIPKHKDTPGPGYYPQRQNKFSQPPHQSFIFKSNSARNVFPIGKNDGKKAKAKLSELL